MRTGETMDNIGCGKWGGWTATLGVLLCFVAAISAQPGFLSIDCGGKTNHTDANNVTWITDSNYIDGIGQTAEIGNTTEEAYSSYSSSLRFFPKPLNKSCYRLPVDPHVPYLIRLWFVVGNNSGFQQMASFAFTLETMGTLYMRNVTYPASTYERILTSSGRVLNICLIRIFEFVDPSISAIELRKLQDGMYGEAKPGSILKKIWRTDVGGYSFRYPEDKFDRIWSSYVPLNVSNIDSVAFPISTDKSTLKNNTKDLPPPLVMQTAWVLNISEPAQFSLGPFEEGGANTSLLFLYFEEIEMMSESRSFYVIINGEKRSNTITLAPTYSALELPFLSYQTDNFQFTLVPATNSTAPPIINAFEYYSVYDTQPATYQQDIEALVAIKKRFNMSTWISDPCFVIEWDGISCHNNASTIRISEINLSRKNLTGLVPHQIRQLTALVNMALDNNNFRGALPDYSNLARLERIHLQNNALSGSVPDWLSELKNLKELALDNNNFRGPLPDFSNLARLERIHLQNNALNGRVPDWLSELKNLKELFLDNNNFSGEIPLKLLNNPSLNFSYSGNPYLCMHKGECIVKNSNKNKWKVVLGITLSGVLIITVAFTIILYRNKFRKKEKSAATERRIRMKNKPKTFLYQDHSMIMVPNPTKSRAFTLDELMTATQSFTQEIGRGGFGSVFFGKLPDETNIAVKVLSLFSRQGAHEFLNEVDLLSRIHHRNLVSLLGYCNESREVMLIYEHMSGGSLSDRLYGARASDIGLNWKTRLKITLDAAQGLEYLHVGCNPKIIHRDIKTANILLDSNLNGKLADFGLSKITIDGEATHVTTAVKGTAGYLDPEYYNTQMLTHKSDVYSFGVVLLEIICGRRPIDLKLPEEELNMVRWVTPYLLDMDENGGNITEIIDKRLGGGDDMKSICRVSKVAMRCVQAQPSARPSVSEVVAELKASISISEETTAMERGDLSTDHRSEPKGMKWGDNSSSLSNVGR